MPIVLILLAARSSTVEVEIDSHGLQVVASSLASASCKRHSLHESSDIA